MTPEEIRYLIPGYLSAQLSVSETELFEDELKKSPALQIELEELRASWRDLALLPEEQPSAAMKARFYRKLNDLDTGRIRPPASSYAWWKPGLSGLVRQSTMVLALFCLGIYVGRVSMSGPGTSKDTSRLEEQVQSLRQTVALSLMDKQSANSRLEGISWSSRVSRPDSDLVSALLNALNHDPNTNVRLASLDALEKFSSDSAVRKSLIQALPLQDSPLVQIALIDGLVQMRDKEAAGEFKKLTGDRDANAAVRQRAEWGLQKLNLN
jgi:hypothetical protein